MPFVSARGKPLLSCFEEFVAFDRILYSQKPSVAVSRKFFWRRPAPLDGVFQLYSWSQAPPSHMLRPLEWTGYAPWNTDKKTSLNRIVTNNFWLESWGNTDHTCRHTNTFPDSLHTCNRVRTFFPFFPIVTVTNNNLNWNFCHWVFRRTFEWPS